MDQEKEAPVATTTGEKSVKKIAAFEVRTQKRHMSGKYKPVDFEFNQIVLDELLKKISEAFCTLTARFNHYSLTQVDKKECEIMLECKKIQLKNLLNKYIDLTVELHKKMLTEEGNYQEPV